ncbi:MAG: VOC family protein [Spirochaetaceae bacterium]
MEPPYGLSWITLHVNNLEKSLRFYNELLGLTVDNSWSNGTYVPNPSVSRTPTPPRE